MFRKSFTAAVIGLSLAALPAMAQNAASPPNASSGGNANKPAEPPHQTASEKGLWQASQVRGLNVYNDQNQKIGSIKELLMNKQGQIEMVAIAVGGFLGVGEHDVAVKFSDLKFSDQPVQQTSSSAGSPSTTGAAGGGGGMGGGGGGGGMGGGGGAASSSSSSSASSAPKNYPDHAVLNKTADELKGMPQFDYNK